MNSQMFLQFINYLIINFLYNHILMALALFCSKKTTAILFISVAIIRGNTLSSSSSLFKYSKKKTIAIEFILNINNCNYLIFFLFTYDTSNDYWSKDVVFCLSIILQMHHYHNENEKPACTNAYPVCF